MYDSSLRSRSIDNYLSREEIELILGFINISMSRFEKYDGRIRMTPPRYKTDELQKLYISKYNQWEKAVKNQMSESSSTYLDFIRKSDKSFPCPIEQFLKTFMQIIEQAIPPNRLQYILQKLETDVVKCEYSCPCPSEPRAI